MDIGIISDTHNNVAYTKEAIEKLGNISYLIHAGDIGKKVLEYLASLPLKTIAIYGNTDRGNLQGNYPNVILKNPPYYFKIANTTFKLMHEPYYLSPDSDVVIYGHTHKFDCQKVHQALILNPGEICAREKPYIETLHLNLDTKQVTRIYKDLHTNQWSQKECL